MTDCQPQRLPPASTTASHLGRLCLDCSQPATILSGAANTGLFLQGARCLKQVSRTLHQPAGNFSSIVLQSETPPPFFPLPFMVVRPALQSEPLPSFCRFFIWIPKHHFHPVLLRHSPLLLSLLCWFLLYLHNVLTFQDPELTPRTTFFSSIYSHSLNDVFSSRFSIPLYMVDTKSISPAHTSPPNSTLLCQIHTPFSCLMGITNPACPSFPDRNLLHSLTLPMSINSNFFLLLKPKTLALSLILSPSFSSYTLSENTVSSTFRTYRQSDHFASP